MFPNCDDEHPERIHEGYCYDCQQWMPATARELHRREMATLGDPFADLEFADVIISDDLLARLIERLSND